METMINEQKPLRGTRNSKKLCIPSRYLFSIMGLFGFFMLYALRVNLSVAMVSMVNTNENNNNNNNTHRCYNNNNNNSDINVNDSINNEITTDNEKEKIKMIKTGKLDWDAYTQGIVMGSFFWGYILTQIPGGRLAEKYGSKHLMGLSIFVTSLLTIISPFAARYNYIAFSIVRALEGVFEGVAYPAMHSMIARWIPISERTIAATVIYSGAQIGTVFTLPIAGVLCDMKFLDGWPLAFYVLGVLGVVWYILWMILIFERPQEDPRISSEELELILKGQGEEITHKNPSIPWRSILTSVPVWALVIAHFGQNWGFYTLLFQLPTYFKSVLNFDIKKNGLLSALPYLMQATFGWLVGFSFSFLIKRQLISVNFTRKFCNTISLLGPALCLYLVTLAKCNSLANILLFILGMALNGFLFSGYNVTHVDMSPDFAGTLMGITNFFANFTGFIAPYVVGVLTKEESSVQTWSNVFYISSIVYVITALIFLIFGSAKLQPWGLARQ